MKFEQLLGHWVSMLPAAVLVVACGGGSGGGSKAAAPSTPGAKANGASTYSIKAHVDVAGHPEQSGWIDVPPIDANAWSSSVGFSDKGVVPIAKSASSAGTQSQGIAGPSRRTQATVGQGTGGAIDTVAEDKRLNNAPGWSLLYWATLACYKLNDPAQSIQALDGITISDHPWNQHDGGPQRDYYVFTHAGFSASGGGYDNPDERSCDTRLAMQETLLCAADHLAQLADAPGTVTWSGSSGDPINNSVITVTIPPQRSQDTFIARDMALNALAHLARLDTVWRNPTDRSSCVVQYSQAATGIYDPNDSLFAGGRLSPYFDPPPLTDNLQTEDVIAAARRRLARKANVLISAARLTRELVERSVQDDISGAQQQLSSSTDYHHGARLAWGVDADANPYNTLRHALRTVFGRLEIGNGANENSSANGPFEDPNTETDWGAHRVTRDDPKCALAYDVSEDIAFADVGSGVAALDEVKAIPGLSARWDDAPAKTPGEKLALSILEREGIVFPPSLIDASPPFSAIRALLLDDAAKLVGADTTTGFLVTESGRAFNSMLDGISEAEMSFAISRVYDAFRLLTQTEPETATSGANAWADLNSAATSSGLPTRAAALLNAAGGIALVSPIPRDDLAIDPMASLGVAQHLSACTTQPTSIEWSPGTFLDYSADALSLRNTDVSAFQNPFLLGETFRRQLSVMSTFANLRQDGQDLSNFAQVGAAEIKKWAGPGSFMTSGSSDLTAQDVYLVNVGPADLGTLVSTNRREELDDLESRLALVSSDSSPAAAANCAAGLRKSCSGVSSNIRHPLPGSASDVIPPSYLGLGLDTTTAKLQFTPLGMSKPGSFLVLLPGTRGKGKVLAWLKGGTSPEWYAESYSDEQRTLAQKIFGVDLASDVVRSCTNESPVTLPSGYCVKDMKRDQFVPLANELNSSGTSTNIDDSWKNYLDLATAAATKSDELGVQLIQQGLEQDVRKESATEELGNLCGSYLSVDDVTAVKGQIAPPKGDQALNECLNAATTDVVFLRDDPFASYNSFLADTKIRQAYCHNPVAATDPPFCARKGVLKHAGLNFHTTSTKPPDTDIKAACQDITNSMSPGISAGAVDSQVEKAPFGNAIATSWATASGIAGALQGLKLEEQADGAWILKTGSRVVTGSDAMVDDAFTGGAIGSAHDVWPRCNTTTAEPGSKKCSPVANFIATMFPAELGTSTDPIHSALRSAVEGTVFYMGALAGGLPANTIRKPIPIANRRSPALQQGTIPDAALYSVSYFERNGKETSDDPLKLNTAPKFLYTITNFDAASQNGYLGKVAWKNDELDAMGGAARPFVSAKEKEYLTERAATVSPYWLQSVYQQALTTANDDGNTDNDGYLYVDTWNAPLAFDQSLSATASADQNVTRDNLRAWLIDRSNEFNMGDQNFVQRVVEASYLTSSGKPPDGSTPTNGKSAAPPPYQFCHTVKAVGGRGVCTGARVSPVFHITDAPATDNVGCDPDENLGTPLSSTVRVHSRDKCLGTYYTSGKTSKSFTLERVGQGCSGSIGMTPPGETGGFTVFLRNVGTGNGWVSPDDAVGAPAQGKGYQWETSAANTCGSEAPYYTTDTSCPPYDWKSPWGSDTSRSLWQDRLKPSVCAPSERLELFLDNRLNELGGAHERPDDLTKRVTAMQTLVRALGISCLSANQHLGVRLSDIPPNIRTTEDINVLEAWVDRLGYNIDQIGNVFYLVDVPDEVIDIAQAGKSDAGAVSKGDRGKTMLELESKLSQLENNFSTLGSTLQQVSLAIDKTRLELQGIELSTEGQQLGIAAARIENERQVNLAYLQGLKGIAEGVIATLSGFTINSLWKGGQDSANEALEAANDIATSVINRVSLVDSANNLTDRAKNIDLMGENAESQAVLGLSQATGGLYQTINDNITALKTNNNDALIAITSLKQNAAQANIALAKASGADFIKINGQNIPEHVNTVYRRQFDITSQRYGLALENAKRTAYLARLSIEQRLGVRLDQLKGNIGPLEAPSTWADDVCTVQGVDYDKLRKATVGQGDTSPGEIDRVKGFANQFVGSYVDKLRQFVQFYNVQFPFVDSTDVAVVSLREDLPSSLSSCVVPSSNLLLFSDKLESASTDGSSTDMISRNGWRVTPCGQGTCLQVSGAGSLVNDTHGPIVAKPPNGLGGATLLSTFADPGPAILTGTVDLDDAGASVPPPPSPAPPASVFQTVSLKSGLRYVLSWWDMARLPNGSPIADPASASTYAVSIFDSNWNLLAGGKPISAAPSTDGATWSDRRSLDIVSPADGEYHVLFDVGAAAVVGEAVAIADVQLEQANGFYGAATAYQSNAGSALHPSTKCSSDTPDVFRSRFQRSCDDKGCFYELRDVLAIDTQLLNEGSSSLIGKLADGNFNYRNNTIALNIVGTGVTDCSQSPNQSCNGSAYVQYDLDHIAYSVPLENYGGDTSCFDFGVGSVRSGKALASERFITLPMSSADRDLISTSPFLKPDLSGRPLSGAYRLRIHDSPQLVWQNVEDIQIVMNYGYWSKVARSPGN